MLRGNPERELAKTVKRFEGGMYAAQSRAARAEKELEEVSNLARKLEAQVQDRAADSVKMNMAYAMLALVTLSFWLRTSLRM